MHFEIVLATHNAHKLKEFRRILAPHGIVLYGLSDLNMPPLDITENALTYFENAKIKAMFLRKFTSLPILADDSGLEIDALKHLLRLHTSRYQVLIGEQKLANQFITYCLRDIDDKKARFHCSLCFSLSEGDYREFDGVMEGMIASVPSGEHGFGYDPIFIPKNKKDTVANLNEEEKDKISHRYIASKKLLTFLKIKGLIRG